MKLRCTASGSVRKDGCQWLDGKADKDALTEAIKQADKECGSCECDLAPLYRRVP